MRILSIDVAFRTLAVCILTTEGDFSLETEDTTVDPRWAKVAIERWSTTDILKSHGCKAKKVSTVPSERLMHYMINFFDELDVDLSSLTHVLIERQMGKNKLTRYLSQCMYTYFFEKLGYSIKRTARGISVVRPKGAAKLEIVHAKYKLTVLPNIDESCIKITPKMNDYVIRKALAVAKTDHFITACYMQDAARFKEAHSFWTGIKTKKLRDDPADALLMGLYVIERDSK